VKNYPPQKILRWDFGPSKFGKDPGEDEEYIGRRMDIIGRSISFCDTDTPDVAVKRWLELGWDRFGEYYKGHLWKLNFWSIFLNFFINQSKIVLQILENISDEYWQTPVGPLPRPGCSPEYPSCPLSTCPYPP
jgi:hypothetical protein